MQTRWTEPLLIQDFFWENFPRFEAQVSSEVGGAKRGELPVLNAPGTILMRIIEGRLVYPN